MDTELHVGIDLGTTNSSCAVCTRGADGNLQIEVLKIRQLTGRPTEPNAFVAMETLPSVVWIRDATHAYTGDFCKGVGSRRAEVGEGAALVRSIKRKIGDPHWSVDVDGRDFDPAEISALLLRTIRLSLEERYPNAVMKSVAIGIPACFASRMRSETLRAAEMAGFPRDTVHLIDEPVAALFSNVTDRGDSFKNIHRPANVLVFDMGGGTLDVSAIRLPQTGQAIQVLSTSRYNEIAGDDLDFELAAMLLGALRKHPQYNQFFENAEKKPAGERTSLVWGLLETAERIKVEELADRLEEGTRGGDFARLLREYQKSGKAIRVQFKESAGCMPEAIDLPISEILQSIAFVFDSARRVRNMFDPVHQALERAEIGRKGIDYIFVTGGSAAFPPVIDALAQFFQKEPLRLDFIRAVSNGAAVWALLNSDRSWQINERVRDALFLRRVGHPFLQVLPPVDVPSDKVRYRLDGEDREDQEDLPRVSGKQVSLEFFQGASVDDPLMRLAHVEKVEFSRELNDGAQLVETSGRINQNKVYEFTLKFRDNQGEITADVSFDAVNRGPASSAAGKHGIRNVVLNDQGG